MAGRHCVLVQRGHPVTYTVEIHSETTATATEEVVHVISVAEQGPQGPRGLRGEAGASGGSSFDAPAAVAIGGHRIVLIDTSGKANYASNDTAAHRGRAIGLTLGAAEADESAFMKNFGEVTEPSWNWTAGLPVFLGTNGTLTQEIPVSPGAKFLMVVGFPISSTSMFLNFSEPISI